MADEFEAQLFDLDRFPNRGDERVVHLVEEGRMLVERMREMRCRSSHLATAAWYVQQAVLNGALGLPDDAQPLHANSSAPIA